MSFHDIEKFCLYCKKKLKLNNTRDIERKKYCSHSCWAKNNSEKYDINNLKPTPESRKKAGQTRSLKMKLGLIPKPPIRKKKIFWNCKICGKPISRNSKQCWSCYLDSRNIILQCEYCGKEFKKKKSCFKFNGYKGRFCSSECRNKWNSENGDAYKEYICSYCGKKFKRYQSQISTNNPTCSHRCNLLLHAKRGKESIFYIDGRTPLRKLIKNSYRYDEWRKLIFERDGFKCVECGLNKNIHAHHIKPFSQLLDEFMVREKEDRFNKALKDKNLWEINNGITLCEQCHSIRHPEVNLMNTKNYYQQYLL